MSEKIIKKELKYKSKLFGIEGIKINLGNGKIVEWERVIFPQGKNGKGEGVAVLAIEDKKNILLIKKYMGAENKRMFSLPMGALKRGFSKLASAKLELAEETGYGAKKWRYIMPFNILPGYLYAQTYFFMAQGLFKLKKPPKGDEAEYLRVYKLPLKKAVLMIKQRKITDARSCAAILFAQYFFI